jgi:hypothetical protein
MNITNQQEELKIINNITRINGYDDIFVNRIYQRQKLDHIQETNTHFMKKQTRYCL